jgi:tRNA(Ile2)-agmatinylcytidine synthase
MGKGQGYRCKKCGAKHPAAEKVAGTTERRVKPGLYVTATRSQRHLTKPLRRYGLEKKHREEETMINDWHWYRS